MLSNFSFKKLSFILISAASALSLAGCRKPVFISELNPSQKTQLVHEVNLALGGTKNNHFDEYSKNGTSELDLSYSGVVASDLVFSLDLLFIGSEPRPVTLAYEDKAVLTGFQVDEACDLKQITFFMPSRNSVQYRYLFIQDDGDISAAGDAIGYASGGEDYAKIPAVADFMHNLSSRLKASGSCSPSK